MENNFDPDFIDVPHCLSPVSRDRRYVVTNSAASTQIDEHKKRSEGKRKKEIPQPVLTCCSLLSQSAAVAFPLPLTGTRLHLRDTSAAAAASLLPSRRATKRMWPCSSLSYWRQ